MMRTNVPWVIFDEFDAVKGFSDIDLYAADVDVDVKSQKFQLRVIAVNLQLQKEQSGWAWQCQKHQLFQCKLYLPIYKDNYEWFGLFPEKQSERTSTVY